mmetsp:Transcript_122994/g.241269  ORF Transcript_122994/g.241269 Transcript_122994/m.241269 type:complete len:917 (-) Transcript_122994:212-2962(-)
MKLKLDEIQAKSMPLTMQGQPVQQPVLKIVAGDFEATTSRVDQDGGDFMFPEAFQLDVNEVDYVNGSLQLEVEAYDFVNNEYVYIGKGTAILSLLLPVNSINIALYFYMDLVAYDPRFDGPRPCEIHMRGLISDKDPIEEELAAKIAELESVKTSFDEYVTSAKALESEMEGALQMAQQKIQKLSKKNTATMEKYNELTDTYNSLTEELTRMQLEIEELKRANRDKDRLNESNSIYITQIEELTSKVTTLTSTCEKYKVQIDVISKEKATMQTEIDELYTTRYESELKQNDAVAELQTEISRLRESQGDTQLIQELSGRIDEMTNEIAELKAKAASAAIVVNSTFITNNTTNNTVVNNSFFETIINSTNETNVYITNVIKSGNVEKIREALINQMRLYDNLKVKNLSLMSKIQQLRGNIQVCCRVRPPSEAETSEGGQLCVDASDESAVYVYDANTSEWDMYEVDGVWGYDHTQADVFGDVEPLVGSVVHGRSACIVAYGDALAGKTFTMSGFGEYLGIKYRSIQKLFEILDLQQKTAAAERKKQQQKVDAAEAAALGDNPFSYKVTISVISVCREQVFDLLTGNLASVSPSASSTALTQNKAPLYDPLTITYDSNKEDVVVDGLTVQEVKSASEGMQLYAKACLAATIANGGVQMPDHTHVILQIGVIVTKDEVTLPVRATLNLVDLASHDGSLPDSDRANKALSTLRTVMTALSNGTPVTNIPFDQSKLTTFLRPTLTGQAKAMLIFNLCPTDLNHASTTENLKFATMVRGIKLEQGGGAKSAAAAIEMKNMESKVRTIHTELVETRTRSTVIERNYEETKKAAQDLVKQLNEHAQGIAQRYQEEKEQNKLLAGDLELTQRNMKKTLDQLKEQLVINERLMGVINVYEEQQKKAEREREKEKMNRSTNSLVSSN